MIYLNFFLICTCLYNNAYAHIMRKRAIKTITVTELRGNIYKLLDEVLNTGIPIEINKGDRKLKIMPAEKVDKLENLVSRPNVIRGNPDEN